MENPNPTPNFPETEKWQQRDRRRRIGGGIILLIIGGLLFAKVAGVVMPAWLFTWPMILIAIGVFAAFKKGFSDMGWIFPIAVGLVFLAEHEIEGFSPWPYLWPVILIIIGLGMMFRRKRRGGRCDGW